MIRGLIIYMLCLSTLPVGCAFKQAAQPVCRHQAIYHALAFSDLTGCPVRIAIGHSTKSKDLHAQAQAFIDGEWRWLEQGPDGVGIGKQDGFLPKEYVKVKDLVDVLSITDPDPNDIGIVGG